MGDFPTPTTDEVEQLLLNAQLRDELEPYFDESLSCLDSSHLPTAVENEFLASILAWERAPILPIMQWFTPELSVPHPDDLAGEELQQVLASTIHKLYEKRIVLDFTDHLTDKQLYCLIFRDILPAAEKKIDQPRNFLHWDCARTSDNPQIWLRYYATDAERDAWADETGLEPPPSQEPPYRRKMPRRPL